ncbi:hypothetical protein bcgnr5412_55540 [Bacillus cereus]
MINRKVFKENTRFFCQTEAYLKQAIKRKKATIRPATFFQNKVKSPRQERNIN